MKKDMDTLAFYDLRGICIRNDWFNAGTNEQYDKLFDMNRNGESVETLAIIIWICTDDWSLEDIRTELGELFEKTRNFEE